MGSAQSKQDHIRYSIRPTIYEKYKYWCRYCGATSNLKAGSLNECSKSCSLQLDNIPDLVRPLSQQICIKCKSSDSCNKNPILQCDGCPRAWHLFCFNGEIPADLFKSLKRKWYCSSGCRPIINTRGASKKKRSRKTSVKAEPSTPPPEDFLDYNRFKYTKKEIETPHWKISTPKRSKKVRAREDFTDDCFIKRHKRFEDLEKAHLPPI